MAVSTTRIEWVNGYLPKGEALVVWQRWLAAHGIEPTDVLIDYIERRAEARQVAYMARNGPGHERCPDAIRSHAARELTHEHVVQLDRVPDPFPRV